MPGPREDRFRDADVAGPTPAAFDPARTGSVLRCRHPSRRCGRRCDIVPTAADGAPARAADHFQDTPGPIDEVLGVEIDRLSLDGQAMLLEHVESVDVEIAAPRRFPILAPELRPGAASVPSRSILAIVGAGLLIEKKDPDVRMIQDVIADGIRVEQDLIEEIPGIGLLIVEPVGPVPHFPEVAGAGGRIGTTRKRRGVFPGWLPRMWPSRLVKPLGWLSGGICPLAAQRDPRILEGRHHVRLGQPRGLEGVGKRNRSADRPQSSSRWATSRGSAIFSSWIMGAPSRLGSSAGVSGAGVGPRRPGLAVGPGQSGSTGRPGDRADGRSGRGG